MEQSERYRMMMKILSDMVPPLPVEDIGKIYSGAELVEDLEFLVKTLTDVHPDLFFNLDVGEFKSQIESIRRGAQNGGKRLAFFKFVARLVAAVGDDHTQVVVPTEEYSRYISSGGRVFPFDVSCSGGIVKVIRSHSVDLNGAEIETLNGLSMESLLHRMLTLQSGNTLPNRLGSVARLFRLLLFLELGKVSVYEVGVSGEDGVKVVEVPGIEHGEITTYQPKDNYNYSILTHGNCCLMKLQRSVDLDAFRPFLAEMFQAISDSSVGNLIIDLRGNGGGQSHLTDELCSYLTDQPYGHFSRIDLKVSEQIREFYRALEPCIEAPPKGLFERVLGEIISIDHDPVQPDPRQPLFTGNVYVITDSYTASSASDMAAVLQDNLLGKIVGAPTGGFGSQYGDSYLFSLPNTFLHCRVSHKFFLRANGDETPGPVIPDILVEGDPLKKVFQLITDSSE